MIQNRKVLQTISKQRNMKNRHNEVSNRDSIEQNEICLQERLANVHFAIQARKFFFFKKKVQMKKMNKEEKLGMGVVGRIVILSLIQRRYLDSTIEIKI